jgi:hypothetical protein
MMVMVADARSFRGIFLDGRRLTCLTMVSLCIEPYRGIPATLAHISEDPPSGQHWPLV